VYQKKVIIARKNGPLTAFKIWINIMNVKDDSVIERYQSSLIVARGSVISKKIIDITFRQF